MSTEQINRETERPPIGVVRKAIWRVYFGGVLFFILCIFFQVFMAGAGIFSSTTWLAIHGVSGYFLALVAILLFLVSLIGRVPGSVRWLSALLVLLVVLQPVLIFLPRRWNMTLLSALHPVNALLILIILLYVALRTVRFLRAVA